MLLRVKYQRSEPVNHHTSLPFPHSYIAVKMGHTVLPKSQWTPIVVRLAQNIHEHIFMYNNTLFSLSLSLPLCVSRAQKYRAVLLPASVLHCCALCPLDAPGVGWFVGGARTQCVFQSGDMCVCV